MSMHETPPVVTALRERLATLRHEFAEGEAQIQELDRRRAQLRDTLLRISGAIQVLEEELGPAADDSARPGADGAAAD